MSSAAGISLQLLPSAVCQLGKTAGMVSGASQASRSALRVCTATTISLAVGAGEGGRDGVGGSSCSLGLAGLCAQPAQHRAACCNSAWDTKPLDKRVTQLRAPQQCSRWFELCTDRLWSLLPALCPNSCSAITDARSFLGLSKLHCK